MFNLVFGTAMEGHDNGLIAGCQRNRVKNDYKFWHEQLETWSCHTGDEENLGRSRFGEEIQELKLMAK